jgi:sister-chromatid-cohesion protein PDS5
MVWVLMVAAEGLYDKLLDPDEKVRAEVCKVYGTLDYETALHHVSASQLKAIADRIRDRKVRTHALRGLCVC